MDNLQNGTLNTAARSVGRDPQVAAWTADLVGIPLVIHGDQVTSLAAVGGRDAGSLLPVLIAGRCPAARTRSCSGSGRWRRPAPASGAVLTATLPGFADGNN